MSQLNIRLQLSPEQSGDYSVLLDYYEQLSKEEATKHFVTALDVFWSPVKAWQTEKSQEQQRLVIQMGIYRIKAQIERIKSRWGEIERFPLPQIPQTQRSQNFNWRIQPQLASPSGKLMDYLENQRALDGLDLFKTSERKYWLPNLAWWGEIAAVQLGLNEESVKAMALNCANLLEKQANFLEKTCVSSSQLDLKLSEPTQIELTDTEEVMPSESAGTAPKQLDQGELQMVATSFADFKI